MLYEKGRVANLPHIYTGPFSGKIIARNILVGLKKVDPEGAKVYEERLESATDLAVAQVRVKARSDQPCLREPRRRLGGVAGACSV